jgi:hypothetical protein
MRCAARVKNLSKKKNGLGPKLFLEEKIGADAEHEYPATNSELYGHGN